MPHWATCVATLRTNASARALQSISGPGGSPASASDSVAASLSPSGAWAIMKSKQRDRCLNLACSMGSVCSVALPARLEIQRLNDKQLICGTVAASRHSLGLGDLIQLKRIFQMHIAFESLPIALFWAPNAATRLNEVGGTKLLDCQRASRSNDCPID